MGAIIRPEISDCNPKWLILLVINYTRVSAGLAIEQVDRIRLVRRGQVRVPDCHLDIAVPQQLTDRVQSNAGHDQVAREGVPQVVEAEVYDFSVCKHSLPSLGERGGSEHAICPSPLLPPRR